MEYTVLVIDDTKRVLDIIEHFLTISGYKVKKAEDPEIGVSIAREGGIDLILLDIMMPKMDGYTVAKLLKTDPKTKEVPIVMLTAKSVIMSTPKNFFYGLYGFLAKPFTKEQLVRTVEEVIKVTKSDEDTQFLKIIEEEGEMTENDSQREP
jgi:two-component system sensor histidine kinase/response regulator